MVHKFAIAKKGMKKYCLSGYYGFSNTGDEAILQAVRQQLQPDVVTVLSKDNRFNIKAILDCDIFISGGGGLFQDTTSSRSFYYYIFLLRLAQLFGKKTCVLSQSIGPLKSSLNRRILKKALLKTNILSVRDLASVELLRQIGVPESKIIKSADPTFLLRTPNAQRRTQSNPFLGVSVRRGEFDERAVAMALDSFKNKYHAEILFIPFQVPQDVEASKKIISLMKTEAGLVTSPHSPQEILKLIGEMDLFLGMRLHSLIFACINSVPMTGIPYDPKVSSFLEEAGQSVFSPDCLEQIWVDREKIKAKLSKNLGRMRDQAWKPFNSLCKL